MAEGTFYRNEQILVLSATDDFTQDRLAIGNIILTGTAAGSFVLTIGNASLTFTTGSPLLSITIPINRHANYIKLVSGPTGATAYVMMVQTP